MELGISGNRLHELWEATLIYRGDYTPQDILKANHTVITKSELNRRITELTMLLKMK